LIEFLNLGIDVLLVVLIAVYWALSVWLFSEWQEFWEDLTGYVQVMLYFGALFWPVLAGGALIGGHTSWAFGLFVLIVGLSVPASKQIMEAVALQDQLARKRTTDKDIRVNLSTSL
tara:strand:+ start:6507 stop:6854 length:348 start_codon:yes stop_codon:yes gene_type:complete